VTVNLLTCHLRVHPSRRTPAEAQEDELVAPARSLPAGSPGISNKSNPPATSEGSTPSRTQVGSPFISAGWESLS
jgi:hypothetical protein